MALKVGDGYDHYNSDVDFYARSGFLQYQSFTSNITFISAANGIGKALRLTGGVGSAHFDCVYQDRNQEAYLGWRFRAPDGIASDPSSGGWFVFNDSVGGSAQIAVYFNKANYSIQAFLGGIGGSSLGISANNVWAGNTFQFIEFGIKIANSGGFVKVKVGGNLVLNLTSIDTQNSANAWFDTVSIYPDPYTGGAQVSVIDLDDHYYADTTSDPGSSANNTFLGDVGTRTLFATGNGTVQWTPNAGTNFSRVNETAMDSDTTYVSTATPTNEDKTNFGPITNVVALIYAVQVTIAARKDDVGPRVIKTGLKSGATTSYGSNHSVPDTYVYFTDIWILDPDTTANWTRTSVNALTGLYNLVS